MAAIASGTMSTFTTTEALSILGDKGYERSPEQDGPSWSKYRKSMFDSLVRSQNADGAGRGVAASAPSTPSINLTIMQAGNARRLLPAPLPLGKGEFGLAPPPARLSNERGRK